MIMEVGELIKELEKYSSDAEVYLSIIFNESYDEKTLDNFIIDYVPIELDCSLKVVK